MVEINSTNKQIKVNVSSAGSETSIGLSTPQTYYDNLAKQWAISESIVNNEDFSSKHYAEESKTNSEASNNVLNAVLTEHEQITAEITSGRTNIASDITAGVETLQTEGNTQKEAVKAEGNAQVAKVQAEGSNYATKAEAKYTAGAGIAIENNVISNTQSSAEWGNIEGDIGNQADLVEYISSSLSGQLATKLDLDATNLNTAGKSYVAELSFPSTKSVDVNLLASGSSYTAPANGWFTICGHFGNITGVLGMLNTTSFLCAQDKANNGDYSCLVSLKASKGDNVVIRYNINPLLSATDGTPYFKFVYAKGDE